VRVREEKNAPPSCPFCGAPLQRPAEMKISPTDIVQGGRCSCGALYLSDPTGKNVGLMMSQALVAAADLLKKEIADLVPDEDYQDAVLSYDWRNHRSTGVSKGYMDGSGRLYIMKVNKKTA
jgi:hypothetical protein